MQWGRSGNVKVNNDITITLPIAFSNANGYKVVTTWFTNNSSYKQADDNPNVTAQTVSNFSVHASNGGAHDSYNMPFNWIAIGY